jgi:RNA polymerase sigma factor (sigma-70 family)
MPQRRTQEQRVPVTGEAMEVAETSLLACVARGERQAFDQLYRQYFPRLARFLGRMARNPLLVEEVINDTMLVVWQKAASYNASCKVSTWVFAIAYRKALKALKLEDAPVEADLALIGSDEQAPEPLAERRELTEVVAQALDRLPVAHRITVVLAFYHDMDYAEIAEVTDCPVNTVKTRMFHARRKLKELLADGWEEIQ